jgi:RNA polymerase sigma-70 factor, ECF subfamily
MVAAFLKGRGDPPSGEIPDWAQELRLVYERAQAAWPQIPLESTAFAAWVGERTARLAVSPREALGKVNTQALYLTCACAAGTRSALAAFEELLRTKAPQWLAGLRPTPDLVQEVLQRMRQKLLMATATSPGRLAQYQGRGSLEGWLQVSATRIALDLRPDTPTTATSAGDDVAANPYVPELSYLKERYRSDFTQALRDAVGSLPVRLQTVLRLRYVERLTPLRIGELFGVHRVSASRWVVEAREHVFHGTRQRFKERLKISTGECDSLLLELKSRMDLTLSSLLPRHVTK